MLFSPLRLGPIDLPNRLAVAPMCQYSADDGSATDWHLQHLATLAMSGAGLVVVEATGVERHGRITHGCLGLYSDANEYALGRVLAFARTVALPGTKFGIQIGHAGRKASAKRPWEGPGPATEDPWITIAPSAIAFDDGWPTPAEMTAADMARVEAAFVDTAKRATRLGFEAIELHMAHGYLLAAFLSPLANKRLDGFGGDVESCRRFPMQVARAVRAAVPKHVALGARITGSDWAPGGLTPDDAVTLATRLKEAGLDYVCVSSGGITPKIRVPVSPGYQVPFAAKVKRESGITTRAVGLIVDPREADAILARGEADQIALARAFLDNPRWGWHAAETLGHDLPRPPQYDRVKAKLWPGAALLRPPARAAQ